MVLRNLILIVTMTACAVTAQAQPLQIEKIDDIPLSNAKEVVFPDGERYLLAAEHEPTVTQGVSASRSSSAAERIASLKARAVLARFINGEEFQLTDTFKETFNTLGDKAEYRNSTSQEMIAVIRGAVLKGVEVIEVDRKPDGVKVVMGVSRRSMGVADYFREGMESHRPELGAEADERTPNSPRQEYWVDPRLRERSTR